MILQFRKKKKMILGLITKVESAERQDQINQLVDESWQKIRNIPEAKIPKDLLNETMIQVWTLKKKNAKRPRDLAKPESKQGDDKHVKIDIEDLLHRIHGTITTNEFERTLNRVNGLSDILIILSRTYCYTMLLNQGKKNADIATSFGSKAEKKKASSSIVQNPKTLHKLIIECKMHKLTKTAPTREDLHSLLTRSSEIEDYLKKTPIVQELWCGDKVTLTLAWFLGGH
jgi:hypothetical protein